MTWSQVPEQIDVQVIVREKIGMNILPLENAHLFIADRGEVQTDAQGRYLFTVPIRGDANPRIDIAMRSDRHKVLKPLDGSVAMDPDRKTMVIEFLVVNMGDESAAFRKRIAELESRISHLQSKNELTAQQLNAYQSKMVDTILYFERNRQVLENQIASLTVESETVRNENEELKVQLVRLEDEVNRLTGELEAALEERYLRQNEHFKILSKNLLEFVQRAKDVRDELPFIKQYYSSAGGYAGYAEKLKNYERVFTEINTQREAYLEGIERYWENKFLAKELDNILQFLLEGVHLKQIRPTVNDINEELRKQKPNSAQKIASTNFEILDVNIKVLEKDVNRILKGVRQNL